MVDFAKMQERVKQQRQALKRNQKTIKPNPGANRFVLLPGWRPGEEHIFDHAFGQHFIKDEAGEIKAVVPCLDAIYGRPCAVCDSISRSLRMVSSEEDVKTLTDAACGEKKRRYLVNVLALDTAEPNTPQILELTPTTYDQLMAIVQEWIVGVFDAETPQIVTIERTGSGLNTKYSVQITPNKHPMPKGVKPHNLDEYVKQESDEAAARAIGLVSKVAGLPSPADKPSTLTIGGVSGSAPAFDADDAALERMETSTGGTGGKAVALDDELEDLLQSMNG